MKAIIKIEHAHDCPLGTNGLRAYHEARDAFASMPPECRQTRQDLEDLAVAEFELEAGQVCRCEFAEAERFWARHDFEVQA